MRGQLRDVAEVASVLSECGTAKVLSVDFDSCSWFLGDGQLHQVSLLRVMVHASDWVSAGAIADRFELAEVPSERARFELDGGRASGAWRDWRGWLPEVSVQHAVSLRVVAAESFDRATISGASSTAYRQLVA